MRNLSLIITFFVATAAASSVFAQTTGSPAASVPQGQVSDPFAQVIDKIDRLNTSMESLQKQSFIRDWGAVIAAIVAAAVAAYSLKKNIQMAKETLDRNTYTARLAVSEKAREEERKALRSQIDEFYAPFLQLRNSSKYLYTNAFSPRRTPEEMTKYGSKEGFFRTLTALIDGHKFTGVDLAILREIVAIGTKTRELIFNKSGLVDEVELQTVLARATAHYRVMEVALEGDTLLGGGAAFEQFTFPREVDAMVQTKLDALNRRLKELQKQAAE